MTTALIDNATLTGVQRILGQAPSRSGDSLDVDLVAFENFVQARLFYDDVSVIDDYIPALREARRKKRKFKQGDLTVASSAIAAGRDQSE